ncbi:MAG: hypothetical protein AB7R90_17385 [Reyranellaceae bacterium]
MASRQGFSGAEPPDRRQPAHPATRRERLVRMAPPANDNRFHGLDVGRLRFTGLRVAIVAAIAALAVALASAAGLF